MPEPRSDQSAESVPMVRKGSCSVCGGPADELWYHTDWWHNLATDCDGRKTGSFVSSQRRYLAVPRPSAGEEFPNGATDVSENAEYVSIHKDVVEGMLTTAENGLSSGDERLALRIIRDTLRYEHKVAPHIDGSQPEQTFNPEDFVEVQRPGGSAYDDVMYDHIESECVQHNDGLDDAGKMGS